MIAAVKIANEENEGIYDPILPLFEDEYASLLKSLKSKKWEVVDCLKGSK